MYPASFTDLSTFSDTTIDRHFSYMIYYYPDYRVGYVQWTPPTTACFRSVPCNSKSLFSFLFSPAPRHRIQVIWSPFSMKGNKPPNPHQDDLFCALGIITRLDHTIPVVRIRQYLLRLHAFENNVNVCNAWDAWAKKKKKVWGLEISYGARDCHSLFPHQRIEGKASAWGWKSWLSCLFLTRMYMSQCFLILWRWLLVCISW